MNYCGTTQERIEVFDVDADGDVFVDWIGTPAELTEANDNDPFIAAAVAGLLGTREPIMIGIGRGIRLRSGMELV